MRVEDLTKFEGECPNIVVLGTYMDIRVPLTKKWKKIINERGDKPNTYHNCLISYISEQIALSGFNMKSIGNLLIKGIVFNQNDYYKYNDVGGFPATINDLGYWDKNRVEPNEEYDNEEKWNSTVVEFTRENVLKQLEEDVRFGFEKALNQRGISASLMFECVMMWNYILEEGLESWGEDDYAFYGLPLFKATAVKYGWDNPIGEDSGRERKYDSQY